MGQLYRLVHVNNYGPGGVSFKHPHQCPIKRNRCISADGDDVCKHMQSMYERGEENNIQRIVICVAD